MRPLWPAQGVSWVSPENLHLTLRFLGAAEDAQIAALREGLTAVAARHEEFTATIEESGRQSPPPKVYLAERGGCGTGQLARCNGC